MRDRGPGPAWSSIDDTPTENTADTCPSPLAMLLLHMLTVASIAALLGCLLGAAHVLMKLTNQ